MDLQRISDELEITALLNRYARAVDSKDWDLYRSRRSPCNGTACCQSVLWPLSCSIGRRRVLW